MKSTALASAASTLVLGLVLLPAVLAHGDGADEHEGHDGGDSKGDGSSPDTYFAHTEHAGVLVAHVALMTLAWVAVLPVGTRSSWFLRPQPQNAC